MAERKRSGVLAAGAVLAGVGVMALAPGASAAVVDVNYACQTPIGPKSAVSPIDIKGVKSGSGYRITMSWQKGVSSSPVELGAGAMKPKATVKLGGADNGTLTVTGEANQAAIPADTPIKISDLSGTYTPKASGKVTFTPGVLTIIALGTTTTCTPTNSPGAALTLDVTAGGGPAPDTPAPQLPQTGPEDSFVALGTLGGTILLTGAAGALWLTRRAR
ncbi:MULTISPECIES: LPXTG cell wall anchor domain-containing protein [unclassified Streptomyces]|uniref:LPXTG cell wall anchor domain-containing protein n=1 Tax=Streptomyces niveiscabiei TaxID=164115 RepID=A0ABW9HHV8_9ACTN|nr:MULTISPECIES: LPXTG cell wall anchor domain-containing protein [unclassified Streptomyces]QZZ28213.1 LPXTG cell wall anchor domain-containing protein [Streptomyces sp. ST1015]